MTFKVFTDNSFRYSLAHIEIDEDRKLIRRTFSSSKPCVSGEVNPNGRTDSEITEFFINDIKWTEYFQGYSFCPELISYDITNQTMVTRYYEPSMLLTRKRPTVDQVLNLYQVFKEHNVSKINGSISNMCFNGPDLIAFDYKYCTIRPGEEEREFYSYDKYLVKIDPELPRLLRELYLS